MSDFKFSIEAIKVNKIYKKKDKKIDALNNFNINIKKGSICGLLGPNVFLLYTYPSPPHS